MLELLDQLPILFPEKPAVLSHIVWFLAATFLLWMARNQLETFLQRLLMSAAHALRFAARWLDSHAKTLYVRADELAVEYFLESMEKKIEGDISQLTKTVHKDLSNYPDTNHRLNQLISDYESSFREAQDVPTHHVPVNKGLNQKIDDALQSGDKSSSALVKIRKEITLQHKRRQKQTKKDSASRMKALRSLRTPVHKLNKMLTKVDALISGLDKSLQSVSQRIKNYREMVKSRDMRVRAAHHSILTQFIIGLFFLFIVTGGAFVNFLLIERPIAEMIGGGYVGGLSLPSVGALLIILIEMASGIMFAEAMQLSHLIPSISHWEPETRKKVAIVCGGLLLGMATVEAGLAFMREMLIAADAQTTALLTGQASSEAADALGGSLPVIVQAGMGFVIPLVLAFAAIPLEIIFKTFRIIMQRIFCSVLWVAGFTLRLLGNLMHRLYHVLVSLYDLIIFFWLVLQSWVTRLWLYIERKRA
jgi:hypothetical protein